MEAWNKGLLFALVVLVIVMIAITQAYARSPLAIAKGYVGTNPTGWSRQWCGKFVDMTLRKAGKPGGGNSAFGYMSYGRPSGCRPGAIVIFKHSHVGIVAKCNAGSVTTISGNNAGSPGNRRVGVSNYASSRVKAFRMP